MESALFFGDQNSLDFFDIRAGALRIPEVGLRLEEAQEIWDKNCGRAFSFQHFLCSDDTTFFKNINLKSLSLAVIQLGLYDRYIRIFQEPRYLAGNTQNDSALLVATREITFSELITNSQACHLVRPLAPLQVISEVVLDGRRLPRYKIMQRVEGKDDRIYRIVGSNEMSLPNALRQLIKSHMVQKIIHIGPGIMDKSSIIDDVVISESIDIDPMLGWFWSSLRSIESHVS
ncbi:MAG: hypothetical protein A2Z20_08840 [Bdellovibrionales bacterium RBG_16_40_8]|nr:MAG: hypothetical protein A2Z20_08840 [Bdellovibrionales bacterium RBG_16_40_8]